MSNSCSLLISTTECCNVVNLALIKLLLAPKTQKYNYWITVVVVNKLLEQLNNDHKFESS